MGAVAFVMADFLQIPYKEVAIAAILPSVMYYAALFIQADLEAARYGFGKVEEAKIPRIGTVLRAGWLFLVPFAVLDLHHVLAQPRARIRGDGGEPRHHRARLRLRLRRQPHEARDLWDCGGRRPPPGCARSW